jgi:hypothetical protein
MRLFRRRALPIGAGMEIALRGGVEDEPEDMSMMNGQLSTGLVQVVAPGTGELLGYAYTVASEGGQLQRWLLYRNPENTFEIVAPPEDKVRWTLEDWQSNVRLLWRPNAYYVWARTDVYEHGGTYNGVRWDRIPDPLPAPRYPKEGDLGDVFQLDPTGMHPISVLQWSSDLWGMAWTEDGLRDAAVAGSGRGRNAEYWLLPAGFKPAGGGGRTSIAVGALRCESLRQFVALANERWVPGAVFAITGCKNYINEVAPAMP